MSEDEVIKALREEYKNRANRLAWAILALRDAMGNESFASRDEIRCSDCTVHLMVFVDPKKKGAKRFEGGQEDK